MASSQPGAGNRQVISGCRLSAVGGRRSAAGGIYQRGSAWMSGAGAVRRECPHKRSGQGRGTGEARLKSGLCYARAGEQRRYRAPPLRRRSSLAPGRVVYTPSATETGGDKRTGSRGVGGRCGDARHDRVRVRARHSQRTGARASERRRSSRPTPRGLCAIRRKQPSRPTRACARYTKQGKGRVIGRW